MLPSQIMCAVNPCHWISLSKLKPCDDSALASYVWFFYTAMFPFTKVEKVLTVQESGLSWF